MKRELWCDARQEVRNLDGKLVCRCLQAQAIEISRKGCTTTLLILPTGIVYVTNSKAS
jgi:hypothetical protein